MEQEYTQITINEWMQWKEDIRTKLQETAQNFVYIGYRLKQIRDSGMLDGAADIFEFANNEYGLGKSTVSRFIAINEKFSEGGNSIELKDEYKRFSSSKLSEMLTLPDSECEMITERTTIKEIRELKNFTKQEAPKHDVDGAEIEYTALQKCIIDFFKDKKQMLNDVMTILKQMRPNYQEAAELINPSGQSSHKKGIIFLFMYDYSTGIKYKDLRVKEPISISWTDYLLMIFDIFGHIEAENVHLEYYGIEEKEEPKIENTKEAETQENQGFEGCCDVATEEEKIEEFSQEKEEKSTESEEKSTDIEAECTETAEECTENEENETEIEPESCERKEISSGLSQEYSEIDTTERETATEQSGYIEQCDADIAGIEPAEQLEDEDNEAAVEPGIEKAYIKTIDSIRIDVVSKYEIINSLIHEEGNTMSDWKSIKARLNGLVSSVEQLIRFMDLAESEEE